MSLPRLRGGSRLIGELDARRAREWEERNLWCTDPYEAVAAEIAAAQNISRGRASGQIHYARVLRDELPAVAAVFSTGVIDIRMVLTIIARTENVEDEVLPRLDAALARHARSGCGCPGPSCAIASICGWPSSIRPGCAFRPRSTTTAM